MEQVRIDVERFFTKIEKGKDGENIPVDYVTYGPFGSLDRSKVTEKVSRLMAILPESDGNLSAQLAGLRWAAMAPGYEAFKAGREIPVSGTPLSSWNYLSHEDAELLKRHRIFTVEDVSGLTDNILQKIALPNARSMVQQAKVFLESADRNRISGEVATLREQMEAMAEELRLAKTALANAPLAADAPRRGRPPKSLPVAVGEGFNADVDGETAEAGEDA